MPHDDLLQGTQVLVPLAWWSADTESVRLVAWDMPLACPYRHTWGFQYRCQIGSWLPWPIGLRVIPLVALVVVCSVTRTAVNVDLISDDIFRLSSVDESDAIHLQQTCD
ncbi:MAG: hypothetical protein CL862_06415 [Cyanobium sp. NAT70]|nr:hypothetical protein [Cyanobium sp. NAT70]